MRITIKRINEALAKKGAKETLRKGNCYFYFADGDASDWRESSVMVCYLSQLTVEQWVAEHERLKNL